MNILKLYFKDVKKIPSLNEEEERELFKRIKEGNKEARDKAINANLPLVINVAKKYMNLGLALEDLIQEGNIGLIKAVDTYNLDKECRFSTHATYWIKHFIMRGIANQGRTVRVPEYMIEINNHIHKITNELTQKLQHIPTDEELAKELKISIKEIREVKETMQDTVSLNETIEIDINHKEEFINFITYKDNLSLAKEIPDLVNYQNIVNLLNKLTKQEIEIIKMRFGLEDYNLHTLEEIGKKYNFSKQAINLMEIKIINKLKNNKNLIERKHIEELVNELELSFLIQMAYIRLENERRENKLPKKEYQFEELIIKAYEILCRVKNTKLRNKFGDYYEGE